MLIFIFSKEAPYFCLWVLSSVIYFLCFFVKGPRKVVKDIVKLMKFNLGRQRNGRKMYLTLLSGARSLHVSTWVLEFGEILKSRNISLVSN